MIREPQYTDNLQASNRELAAHLREVEDQLAAAITAHQTTIAALDTERERNAKLERLYQAVLLGAPEVVMGLHLAALEDTP